MGGGAVPAVLGRREHAVPGAGHVAAGLAGCAGGVEEEVGAALFVEAAKITGM